MTPNAEIFISEISYFRALYLSKYFSPRITRATRIFAKSALIYVARRFSRNDVKTFLARTQDGKTMINGGLASLEDQSKCFVYKFTELQVQSIVHFGIMKQNPVHIYNFRNMTVPMATT